MEERRLLFAVALSLVVLTAYSLLFSPASVPEKPAASPPLAAPAGAAAPTPPTMAAPNVPAEAGLGDVAGPGATPARSRPRAPPAIADERERRVEVAEQRLHGGLHGTREHASSPGPLLRHLDARGASRGDGAGAGRGVRPLDLETGDNGALDARLREALYRALG